MFIRDSQGTGLPSEAAQAGLCAAGPALRWAATGWSARARLYDPACGSATAPRHRWSSSSPGGGRPLVPALDRLIASVRAAGAGHHSRHTSAPAGHHGRGWRLRRCPLSNGAEHGEQRRAWAAPAPACGSRDRLAQEQRTAAAIRRSHRVLGLATTEYQRQAVPAASGSPRRAPSSRSPMVPGQRRRLWFQRRRCSATQPLRSAMWPF
jgi:hypothetical protein